MDVSEDSLKEARKIWSFPITSSELAAGLLSQVPWCVWCESLRRERGV